MLQKQKARQPARYLINQPASQSGKSVQADQLYQVHKVKVVKKKKKQVERQGEGGTDWWVFWVNFKATGLKYIPPRCKSRISL